MNELAQILANHEKILRHDQEIIDLLRQLNVMLIAGLTIGVIVMILQIVTLLSKWYIRAEQVELLRRSVVHAEEAAKHVSETQGLMKIVQEWAASARTNAKESALVLKEVKEHGAMPDVGGESMAVAVAAIPEKTAERVVEKIKKGDSGVHPRTPASKNPT